MNLKRFEDIMSKAIEEAELIHCPLKEFYAGLEAMRDMLDERISLEVEEA